MIVALYARYSSDNQRAASIPDQLRLCRQFAERQGWIVGAEYTDSAISGASLLRPGFQALMRDALARSFGIVLAESLDRFSRDQEDTAGLFKRLTFLGVRIVTLSEGDITHLHVGFKGTMNALFLQDLADKTRRGMRGRIEAGKSGGGLCYGYRVVPGEAKGERTIEPTEAAVVRRIFADFVAGYSPKAIAKALNAAHVPGPAGLGWTPSTIHGHASRGTGILNNALYIGQLVWNRHRYVKDPDSGKRQARLNPPEAWVTTAVPSLRIVDADVWEAVKARQVEARQRHVPIVCLRRPKYLFSGLTKCGICGGGYVLYSHVHLSCFAARARGTCPNRLTIKREEVERRVLTAMQTHLLSRECFAEFCAAFTEELNLQRRAQRTSLTSHKRELATVERQIQQLVTALAEGMPARAIRDALTQLEAQRAELLQAVSIKPPPALHPSMADVFHRNVTALCAGLLQPEQRTAAIEALRGLVDRIVLTPVAGRLGIVLEGNLAAMLLQASGGTISKSGAAAALDLAIKVVAGARSRLVWRTRTVAA